MQTTRANALLPEQAKSKLVPPVELKTKTGNLIS